jgi:hypothetical protein
MPFWAGKVSPSLCVRSGSWTEEPGTYIAFKIRRKTEGVSPMLRYVFAALIIVSTFLTTAMSATAQEFVPCPAGVKDGYACTLLPDGKSYQLWTPDGVIVSSTDAANPAAEVATTAPSSAILVEGAEPATVAAATATATAAPIQAPAAAQKTPVPATNAQAAVSPTTFTPEMAATLCDPDCVPGRFAQLMESNGFINTNGVKMGLGPCTTLNLPAGIMADLAFPGDAGNHSVDGSAAVNEFNVCTASLRVIDPQVLVQLQQAVGGAPAEAVAPAPAATQPPAQTTAPAQPTSVPAAAPAASSCPTTVDQVVEMFGRYTVAADSPNLTNYLAVPEYWSTGTEGLNYTGEQITFQVPAGFKAKVGALEITAGEWLRDVKTFTLICAS